MRQVANLNGKTIKVLIEFVLIRFDKIERAREEIANVFSQKVWRYRFVASRELSISIKAFVGFSFRFSKASIIASKASINKSFIFSKLIGAHA